MIRLTRRAWPGTLEITPLYIARQREDSGIVYRVVNAQDEQALEKLTLSGAGCRRAGGRSASKMRHRRNEA